ncbi:MAG: histidine kinase [Flavobacteriales bacterium]|nr:histidine kinase [Flavobacteriales bacterium]
MRSLFLALAALVALRVTAQEDPARLKALHLASAHDSLEAEAHATLAAHAEPDEERYDALYHLAFARSGKDDAVAAIRHGQEALLIARELQDTVRIMGSLYQLIKFNVEARHYEEADRLRYELLSLAKGYGKDARHLALAHNAVGSLHSRELRHDSAEHHYREGLRVLGDAHGTSVRQALIGNLAGTLGETGRHAEAIALHREALALVNSSDLPNRAWSLRTLAQSLIHAGRYEEALAAMHEGDSLNRLGGNALDLAIDFAELRADALDSLGDHRGAYAMIKLARDLQDTLFARSLDEQYLELEKRFETRLKEEEIQRLDAEAREREERLRVRNVQLYGSLALAVLALGAAALVWRNLREKRRYSAALEKLNAELNEQKTRIEEINRLLQLKVLRTQMNPHFIYNSLNAIHNLVRKGEVMAAAAYLDGFARLLRMVLDHSVKERVPLSDEITFLRQYLKLEALRFDDGLDFSVDADRVLVEDEDLLVPTLLVQPFAENAVWHGLAPKQGAKKLTVRFAMRGDQVVCTVEDNGVGRNAAPKRAHPDGSPSLGLQLTNERLQLLAFKLGDTGRVTFTDLMEGDAPAGTRVEVVLG